MICESVFSTDFKRSLKIISDLLVFVRKLDNKQAVAIAFLKINKNLVDQVIMLHSCEEYSFFYLSL